MYPQNYIEDNQNHKNVPKSHRLIILIATLISVLILGGVGASAYFYFQSHPLDFGHDDPLSIPSSAPSQDDSVVSKEPEKSPDQEQDQDQGQGQDSHQEDKKPDQSEEQKPASKPSEQPSTSPSQPSTQPSTPSKPSTPSETPSTPSTPPSNPNAGYDVTPSGAVYYPYYNLLSTAQRALYNDYLAAVNNYQARIVPSVTITVEQLETAIEAMHNDHPEVFWSDINYSIEYYESDNVVAAVRPIYNSTINDIANARAAFNAKANAIIAGANKFSTNYEKEKYVHDQIANNTIYLASSSDNQSAYSALVSGRSVCAGFAKAFQYIMIRLGIPTYYVTGLANGSIDHAWNIVQLGNEYYNVDVTWDNNTHTKNYFNITDATLSAKAYRYSLSSRLPACNGTRFVGYK